MSARSKWFITAFSALAVAACGGRQATVESESPGGIGLRWTADLARQGAGGQLGTASASLAEGGTFVRVELTAGRSGGHHPWHVHEGTCGSGGAIVGEAGAYPVLDPDSEGAAAETAILDVELDPDESYYVNIHNSPDDLGTIVGCGVLRPL